MLIEMIITKIELTANCGFNNYNKKNCNLCVYGKQVGDILKCSRGENTDSHNCPMFKENKNESFASIFRRLF